MINYDSILSAFDGKPTLLQWLKMVKKALDESILKNVDITQNSEKVIFSFNFEDGTSISTPEVTLPKGDTGATGPKGDTGATGPKGDTGPKGNDGVSITGINTIGNEVVGDETLTTLRAHYSNDTTDDFVVSAKNGKDASAGGKMYLHSVKIDYASTKYISFNVYSSKENLTLEDALAQIPDYRVSRYIPVVFEYGNYFGVLSASKEGSNGIKLKGLVYNTTTSSSQLWTDGFIPTSISDNLLGENL